jgi:hypothetical protein
MLLIAHLKDFPDIKDQFLDCHNICFAVPTNLVKEIRFKLNSLNF